MTGHRGRADKFHGGCFRAAVALLALTATLLPRVPAAGVADAAPEPVARRGRAEPPGRGEFRMPTPAFRTEVPSHPVDLLQVRPTPRALTLSVLAHEDLEGYVSLGVAGRSRETPRRRFPRGEPVEVAVEPLLPGARHPYEFRARRPGEEAFSTFARGVLVSPRAAGNPFTFTVQADPHLDYGTDPDVYRKSLTNVLASRPDFHVDLGDTFMTDKYLQHEDAAVQYLAQRYYFGIVGPSVPVFLALGNHDGEQPGRGGDGEGSMPVWSNRQRKKYFPNPVPNEFYSGNRSPHPQAGLLQDYYAWEWGDALFLVLDPYWNSPRSRGRDGDNWSRTLGREQYDWLRQTLASSHARFCFVFIHQLVGGGVPEGRGGAEVAPFFEWGGQDLDGNDAFTNRRPGWSAPIHRLLAAHGSVVVFHGHDHFYAHQERDGVVYQLVPQPGHVRSDNLRSAVEYGYRTGDLQGASGILRVQVTPDQALLEYVRAYPAGVEDAERFNGKVTHRYRVGPRPSPPR